MNSPIFIVKFHNFYGVYKRFYCDFGAGNGVKAFRRRCLLRFSYGG